MRVVLGVVLAFVVGFAAIYVAIVAASLWYMQANSIADRDGGIGMAVMFAIGPLAGLLGGIVASVFAGVWFGRRERARAARELAPAKPWPLPLRLTSALLAGIAAYLAAGFVLIRVGPASFQSYGAALAYSMISVIAGVAVTGLIAYRLLRNRP